MITILKAERGGLTTLSQPEAGCWINVVAPTADEVADLRVMGIPADYLSYPLDPDERARSERENGDLLIILRIPHYQGEGADIPYITIPLGIIMTPDYLVTVVRVENELVEEMSSGRVRGLETAKRVRFVLRVLLQSSSRYLSHLRQMTRVIDALEDQLQESTRNREVLELLKYQKSLTYFTTALRSNELMMERLQRSQWFAAYPEDEDLLEDVITENRQAIEMTNITSNILSSMMDAFASIISNNLNRVMKLLASITIVVSLPTMVASFYGMNVGLPLAGHAWAFVAIIGIALLMSLISVFVFWKRDWF
ncbi:MAG TPA: magnesium transporter CorA family protein [Acidimicrobiia bacterium]|nr:magnesium transporter CorA family protein [Acidimicrobiia bacterium]